MAAQSVSADRLAQLSALRFGVDELPLDYFRAMDDETIETHEGIGPRTREQIRILLAELDSLDPLPAAADADDAADDSPHHGGAEAGERQGRGAGLMIIVVAALLLVVTLIVFAVQRNGGLGLRSARTELAQLRGALSDIALASATAAEAQAGAVLQAAQVLQLGDAMAQLDNVDRSLTALETTQRGGSAAGDDGQPTAQAAALGAARVAVGQTRALLALEQPAARADIVAACTNLLRAVSQLNPKAEEQDGQAH